MSSQIAAMVDYSAYLAASQVQNVTNPLTGGIVGVRSVYGAGQNLYPDPLRAGSMIAPAIETITEPYTHVSDIPDAPSIVTWTQDLLVELEWVIPMRLYVPRAPLEVLRATLLPFYDVYLRTFFRDSRLGGLATEAHIAAMRVGIDDLNGGFLAMDLHVLEEVHW